MRKPRRFCPAIRSEICALCCGTQREVSISCPLDCEFLLESRTREKLSEIEPDKLPHRDIQLSDEFLERIDALLGAVSQMLLSAALLTPGAVDRDIQKALDAMIQTYRTKQSGLIYETRPDDLVAASLQQRLQAEIDRYAQALTQERGMTAVRDADVLGALVFLRRLALYLDNSRPRGRAFVSYLLQRFPPDPSSARSTPVLTA